jgi:hypothetical protein
MEIKRSLEIHVFEMDAPGKRTGNSRAHLVQQITILKKYKRLSWLQNGVKEKPSRDYDFVFTLLLVGAEYVGKSCILNRFDSVMQQQ